MASMLVADRRLGVHNLIFASIGTYYTMTPLQSQAPRHGCRVSAREVMVWLRLITETDADTGTTLQPRARSIGLGHSPGVQPVSSLRCGAASSLDVPVVLTCVGGTDYLLLARHLFGILE